MSITADEVNFLIWRYLQEGGYTHTAFTFYNEGAVGQMPSIKQQDVPPGALVAFLKKGLEYVSLEEHVNDDGTIRDCDAEFSLVRPHVCNSTDTRPLPPLKAPGGDRAHAERVGGGEKERVRGGSTTSANDRFSANQKPPALNLEPLPAAGGAASIAPPSGASSLLPPPPPIPPPPPLHPPPPIISPPSLHHAPPVPLPPAPTSLHPQVLPPPAVGAAPPVRADVRDGVDGGSGHHHHHHHHRHDGEERPKKQAKLSTPALGLSIEEPPAFPESDVLVMSQHAKEVFVIAWNPVYDLLVTGSGDQTARIWKLPREGTGPSGMKDEGGKPLGYEPPIVLRHSSHGSMDPSPDTDDRMTPSTATEGAVTCVEWTADGERLCTGCYDGVARIWRRTGELVHALHGHTGAIFALRWNAAGSYLVSGSFDQSVTVWDTQTGQLVQKHGDVHEGAVLDVSWRNNTSFATCSVDKTIKLFNLGENEPYQVLMGHTDEVNAVAWDGSGELLASCSDDQTAKIWRPDRTECVADLRDHKKEVYTFKWGFTGLGAQHPDKTKVLATASYDCTVKLWDSFTGKCISTLARHQNPVYALAFDKEGDYIASGALKGSLYVWSLKDGSIVRSYQGGGDIFEVAWDRDGSRVGVAFSTGQVVVLHFRR